MSITCELLGAVTCLFGAGFITFLLIAGFQEKTLTPETMESMLENEQVLYPLP